jgi:prepilin-type N-terminal cleavage/methylation domain-containing protein
MKGDRMFNRQAKPSRNFTLIELMVVVAIIGILVSILMPALGKAREMAKEAVCLSNRKQNMSGLHLYLNDNGSHFPVADNVNSKYCFSYFIKFEGSYVLMGKTIPYNGDDVLTCPNITDGWWSGPSEDVDTQRRWLSYNGGLFYGYNQSNSPTLHSTEEKAIFGDLILRSTTLGSDHLRKVKIIAFIDGSVRTIKNSKLGVLKILPNWPSNSQYKTFWDSMNELY